jgi:hypothetical protein
VLEEDEADGDCPKAVQLRHVRQTRCTHRKRRTSRDNRLRAGPNRRRGQVPGNPRTFCVCWKPPA